jgi:hypothetical protein
MLNQLMTFLFSHWVNPITLQVFVKNSSATCCVAYTEVGEGREQDAGSIVVLVKGIAINCKQRLAGHVGISHKSMFNCKLQVKD